MGRCHGGGEWQSGLNLSWPTISEELITQHVVSRVCACPNSNVFIILQMPNLLEISYLCRSNKKCDPKKSSSRALYFVPSYSNWREEGLLEGRKNAILFPIEF